MSEPKNSQQNQNDGREQEDLEVKVADSFFFYPTYKKNPAVAKQLLDYYAEFPIFKERLAVELLEITTLLSNNVQNTMMYIHAWEHFIARIDKYVNIRRDYLKKKGIPFDEAQLRPFETLDDINSYASYLFANTRISAAYFGAVARKKKEQIKESSLLTPQ
jgi:hypothetical protein